MTNLESLLAREREAFRLLNAATYYIPFGRELLTEIKAWMDGSPAEAHADEPSAKREVWCGVCKTKMQEIRPGVWQHDGDCISPDAQDAERYRWLKRNHLQTGTDSWIRTGDDLEEAIDEGRRAENRTGES